MKINCDGWSDDGWIVMNEWLCRYIGGWRPRYMGMQEDGRDERADVRPKGRWMVREWVEQVNGGVDRRIDE